MTDELRPGWEIPGDPLPESRWGPGSDFCPHPERWHSTDGDSTEIEVADLAYGLVRALQPSLCVETGAGFGQVTEQIARALYANNSGFCIAIESDHDRCEHVRARLVAAFGSAEAHANGCLQSYANTSVVEQDSLAWGGADDPNGEIIDFAWLDTNYECRVPELRALLPRMRVGTVVCFHDTAPEHGAHRIPSGLDLQTEIERELVDLEVAHGTGVRLIRLPTPRGLTICEVTKMGAL